MGCDSTAFVFFGFVLEDQDAVRAMCESLNLQSDDLFSLEDEPEELLTKYLRDKLGTRCSSMIGGSDANYHYCFVLGVTFTSVNVPDIPVQFRPTVPEKLILDCDWLEPHLGLNHGSIDWHVGALYL